MKPAPKNNPILSVYEAAAILRVSHTTVRKLVDTKQLPGFRIGRRQLLRRIDVLAFADRAVNAEGATAPAQLTGRSS